MLKTTQCLIKDDLRTYPKLQAHLLKGVCGLLDVAKNGNKYLRISLSYRTQILGNDPEVELQEPLSTNPWVIKESEKKKRG